MLAAVLEASTRRRLGGAVLVLAGLAIAAVVLWPGGDDEPPKPPPSAVRLVTVPELGLALAHPRSWTRSVVNRVIRLRSPERSSVLTFASFAGNRTAEVKATLMRELRKRFAPADIVRDGRGRLGDRQVTTFELRGFGPEERVRALVIVEDAETRTHAITLLTPIQPSLRRLREAQAILDSVQLSKPVRPKLKR